MGVLYLLVGGFTLLTAVYLVVSAYSASVRREKLEKEWDGDPAREGASDADRFAFIEQGMDAYRHGLRRKLIVLVYIVPVAFVLLTIYLVNFQ